VRIKVSTASANENLIRLINQGYTVLSQIKQDYSEKKEKKSYNEDKDNKQYEDWMNQWGEDVVTELSNIFPTELESNQFTNPEIPFGVVSGDYRYQSMIKNYTYFIRGLEVIRNTSLPQYTDLPMHDRLYIEDIDSFKKVRDINPSLVASFLQNGKLDWTENNVQLALEQILSVSFHKEDWGGEINDLYTANVIVNGVRRATGFLLKGPGIGHKQEMTIGDCGINGDQLVRLFTTPADLFIVQYIGPIAELLIKDVQGKVTVLRSQAKIAHFLIMDGQDTARLLYAYGKLSQPLS
jgi:hypothetical protein